MKRILFLVAVIAVSGCSAHSPMIIKNTVDTESRTTVQYPPTQQKIFITGESLPADSYDVIARIDVGKIWYGSSQNVLVSLADRARELGADAVIEVKTWHQPSGFSWAAPHGSGMAVKLKDRASIEKDRFPGIGCNGRPVKIGAERVACAAGRPDRRIALPISGIPPP